ncbi:polysaccharide pyruvyl transferase family protein [Mycolicibacterium doricum]|uniref:polysaccharide pyruvyl transferase family protein n=1 Tax=Mycolicibacterium doricum TaxID=126673 RepID=UPI0013D2C5A1|nr:polysaccharide pyruvyl transferase family protein [Mycolicibacterium doricum]MCV7269131.1 polysaccharide pyruvyl transferase family protein [Mycolicibacterium doricum]
MNRPTSFLSVKTQFENAGDALINRELVRICSRFSDVVVDTSRCPDAFLASMHLEEYSPHVKKARSASLFFTLVLQRVLRRPGYYFLIPGGYVGEKHGIQLLSLIANTAILAGMKLLGVRVCHVGVSYERLGSRHARILALRSRLMHCLLARDASSRAYAESLGIRIDGLIPDLAFGAVSYRCDISGNEGVALSFRVDQMDSQRSDAELLIRHLDEILPKSADFKFIAQVQRDAPFMHELAMRKYPSGRSSSFRATFSDADEALDAYAGCKYVLSNRLHVLLFGMIAGCEPIPCVDETVNRKVVGIFDLLGIRPVRSTDIPEGLGRSLSQAGNLGSVQISSIVASQERALHKAFSAVFCNNVSEAV